MLNQTIKIILIKIKNYIFIVKLIRKNIMLIVKNARKIFVKNAHAITILKILKVNMIIFLLILKLKNYQKLIMKPKI